MTFDKEAWSREYRSKPGVRQRSREAAHRYDLRHREERRAAARKRGRLETTHVARRKRYDPARRRAEYLRPGAKQRQRDLVMLRKYSLTREAYADFLAGQRGLCAMCGKPYGKLGPRIDHDHETGRVRGLLCDVCNRAVGFIERYGALAKVYLK
jgi:5-methylcytosine-specific restriction endonuclease McrA